jgi:hypothetical protein
MAHAIRLVGRTILRISVFVVRLLSVLTPLIKAITWISNIFTNKWVAAITAATVTAMALVAALTSIAAAASSASAGLIAMAISNIAAWISSMQAAIVTAYEFVIALGAVRGALVATGIGALVVGAGILAAEAASTPEPSPTSSRRRGGSGGNTVIIEGDVKNTEMNRLMDEMGPTAREEDSIRGRRKR